MEVIGADLNVCYHVLSYVFERFVQIPRLENVQIGPLCYWNKYSKECMFLRLINCKVIEIDGRLFNLILSQLFFKNVV